MLQKLSEDIAECLAHAAAADCQAEQTPDPTAKRDYAEMAGRWRGLAESYQFVERVERFLADTRIIGSIGRPK